MAPRYNPPTRVVTNTQPYLSMVSQADPNWQQYKYREIQYAFDGRVVTFNPYTGGAYNRLDNEYPVGQQYGSLDPLVEDALEPTVGNDVPGLFVGVPDGKGWA